MKSVNFQTVNKIKCSVSIDKNYSYKPNLEKIVNDPLAVFVIELFKGWFRIIRIKNERRTHDFIIGEFNNGTIHLENDKSQSSEVHVGTKEQLKSLFKDKKIYMEYDRPGRGGSKYFPKKSTKVSVDKLFEEFTKAYAQTKPGQAYPKWFDDQQLRWINNVVKSSQISN